MATGEIRQELVNATPFLRHVIYDAQSHDPSLTGIGLVEEIHQSTADVAVAAYKAGIMALESTAQLYSSLDGAAERLILRADLATLDLHDRDRWTTHSTEVTELLDSVPSFIPFDSSECAPPEGFTAEHRENWQGMTTALLDNFKICEPKAFEAIAAELGFRYYLHLKSEGVTGADLLNRVKAFEVTQVSIIRSGIETGDFRQPDQDDHAFEHYLEDLSNACIPVWHALTGRKDSRWR